MIKDNQNMCKLIQFQHANEQILLQNSNKHELRIKELEDVNIQQKTELAKKKHVEEQMKKIEKEKYHIEMTSQ
jgi:hypothetical protein